MNEMFKTENVATTNKLLATFLRYRGFIFTLSNGNGDPRILTFNFESVPRYVIEEFKSGNAEITRFRNIYNVREMVNEQLRKYQVTKRIEEHENKKSIQAD